MNTSEIFQLCNTRFHAGIHISYIQLNNFVSGTLPHILHSCLYCNITIILFLYLQTGIFKRSVA